MSPASERPHIQNDTITINHRFATDHIIKLSISHALSQVRWLHWLVAHMMNAERLQLQEMWVHALQHAGVMHVIFYQQQPLLLQSWPILHAEHQAVRLRGARLGDCGSYQRPARQSCHDWCVPAHTWHFDTVFIDAAASERTLD
jgi:hypothetical protein